MGTGPAPGSGAVDGCVRALTASGTNVYVGTDAVNVAGHPAGRPRREMERLGLERLGANAAGSDGCVPALDLDQRADDVRLARLRRRAVPERGRRSARRLHRRVRRDGLEGRRLERRRGRRAERRRPRAHHVRRSSSSRAAASRNAGGNALADFVATYPLAGAAAGGGGGDDDDHDDARRRRRSARRRPARRPAPCS